VLFDEEGRAKLSDFGIARMAAGDGTLTEAGTVLGTAAYISPEQASGLPATAASDVYSFGVLLFRMLTGRLPFESADPMTLVVQHRDEPPPLVTDIRPDAPDALADITTAALAKDPAARPPNGAALVDALGGSGASLAADIEVTRVMPGVGPPPRRPRPRRALAVAVLLVLALAGGVLAYEVTRAADGPRVPAGTLPSTRSHSTTTRHSTTTTTASTSTTAPATTTAPTTTRHVTTIRLPTTTRPAPATTFAATTTLTFTTTTVPTTTDTTTAPTTTG